MLYVDDEYFDEHYFERCFALFGANPVLAQCTGKRITTCMADPALWLALCLYIKHNQGSVFPLPVDTPIDAARRRAALSDSQYLLFGTGVEALDAIETVAAGVPSDLATHTPALIQMSSGTTGDPKCIARSWASIDLEIKSYVRHFTEANDMTPVIACPITHSYGLISGVLVALERKGVPRVIKNLNPKYITRKLHEVTAPLLYSSPTLITAVTMLATPNAPIHAVMTSGAQLQNVWFEGVRKQVVHLYQQYGCSEAGCISLGQNITAANDVGTPLPHVEVLAGGSATEPQEIVVKLPAGQVIQTRDLGYFEGGKLHFVSRVDDMINVAGLNVYPSEVEEVVLRLPNVTDAVVFKREFGFGNNQVCLHFVATTAIAHQRVREWCAQHLASHQVPMSITQVETIPKLPNGKVSRKSLASSIV